ncbi:MBL fold metallo-hydrolase, partial [bacterium]|nr:MBL fold metallo-hydrolase [bacterium]
VAADGTSLSASLKEWNRDISRFLVHALGQESTIEGVSETGEGQPAVSVRYLDDVLYKVYVDDSSGLISKLEFTEAHDRFGDLAREWIFSDYRQVGDVQLPFSLTIEDMGLTAQVVEWEEISVNDPLQEDLFEIPESIRETVASVIDDTSIRMTATELAKGVYFGETKGMSSMWVEFEDFVLVAEGPNNEGQSLEVIRQIRETSGDKPIRYLVTTHHHQDHTGGIRTYASEGAIVITHANNEAPIREQLTLPHTLNPDRLAQSQTEPQMELVTDRKTITDGTRTVELLHFPNPHTDGYLTVYLPRERIIFQSDMFTVLNGETGPPVVRPEAQDFHDAVIQAGWKVDQIVPGHGRLLTWKDLVDALEASKSNQ